MVLLANETIMTYVECEASLSYTNRFSMFSWIGYDKRDFEKHMTVLYRDLYIRTPMHYSASSSDDLKYLADLSIRLEMREMEIVDF